MANKPQAVDKDRKFTRSDFMAMRAFVNRLPMKAIAKYLPLDELQEELRPAAAERYMLKLQDELIDFAIESGHNSVLANHLRERTRKNSAFKLSQTELSLIQKLENLVTIDPSAEHRIGLWFRPIVAEHLRGMGIQTVGNLIDYCNRMGGSWWRSVPRIGPGRAAKIVSWLREHHDSLGKRVDADVLLGDPELAYVDHPIVLEGGNRAPVPMERIAAIPALSGQDGANRSLKFPYISARNDLEAVRAYLHKFRDQPKTYRAYTKEIERFLLWAVMVRGEALSSVLVDGCEAYKDFLLSPRADFVGKKVARKSGRWRPFEEGITLSAESRLYAVRALRACFKWLVDVRYLDGNPWMAVSDPIVVQRENEIQVQRALPANVWDLVRDHMDVACERDDKDAKRWRAVRAAIYLMGDSGLRREEVCSVFRSALRMSAYSDLEDVMWELTVIGKRRKERTVPVSEECIAALRSHAKDRSLSLDHTLEPNYPLLGPTSLPPIPQVLKRHGYVIEDGNYPKDLPPAPDVPYTPDAIGSLVEWARKKMLTSLPDLTPDLFNRIEKVSPHSFRHTFATLSLDEGVPVHVAQKVLGHRSLATTTIYVNAERKEMVKQYAARFGKRRAKE